MRAVVIPEAGRIEIASVDGVLDPEMFISDRLPFARYDEALDRMARGIGRKLQVLPGDDDGKVA